MDGVLIKVFWFPAAKYIEQNTSIKSIFYIDLNFFGSNSKNVINTSSKKKYICNSFIWFSLVFKKKIDCLGLLNFFSAPSFINFQKNPKKAKITLDLMIKKFKNHQIMF